MANTPQSKKRARQIERVTAVNKARRSRIRTFLRKVEEAIAAAVAGDMAPFRTLFDAVTHPREARPEWVRLADAPLDEQVVRQTFCGT